mgnify:CR=1 FL=1
MKVADELRIRAELGRLDACKCRMTVLNLERESLGMAFAYGEQAWANLELEYESLAKQVQDLEGR